MRVFTAILGTETNTFSPFLTGLENFERTMLVRNGEHGAEPRTFGLVQVQWREMAAARGWEVVESLAAFAMPAGITLRHVYESLRDEILEDLRAAMPVDMVLLGMHGAMVAEGYDDAEGDLISSVRSIVGPDVPIGGELDLHCHLTQQMADDATVLIAYKEYPHTDILPRAVELFEITAAAAEGAVRPHMSLHDCGMIGVFHTSNPRMREYIDHMQALEQEDGILSVSLGHGFPWGDVADMGTRVLVVTDDAPDKGAAVARSLCERMYALRHDAQPAYRSMDQALDEALACDGRPVVLADVSDNAGGGAPNDSTFLFARAPRSRRGQRGHRLHLGPDRGGGGAGSGGGRGAGHAHRRQDGAVVRGPGGSACARGQDRARGHAAVQRRHGAVGGFRGAARDGRARGRRHRGHQHTHADV